MKNPAWFTWLNGFWSRMSMNESAELAVWRDRFTRLMYVSGAVILPLSMTYNVPFFIAEKRYGLIAVDVAFWLFMLSRLFVFKSPSKVTRLVAVCTLYGMAVIFVMTLGPFGARPAWLVTGAVFAGINFGALGAAVASLFNACILMVLYGLMGPEDSVWASVYAESTMKWIALTFNISCLSLASSLGVGLLLSGLDRALCDQRDTAEKLRKRSGELERAYTSLQGEVEQRNIVEKALRESEEKYRELVQNANSIILRMDTQGIIRFFNEFAQSFFGYSEEEVLGKNVVGTIVPERDGTGRDLREMVLDIARHPERYTTNENENIKRDGSRVWSSWTNKAIRAPEGNVVEILCVGHDVTERRTLEAQLQSAQRMEAVGTLAGGIAHDFNNILGGIIGYVELAMTVQAPDPANKQHVYLSRVLEAGNRAKDLVQQILTFSRGSEPSIGAIALKPIIKESIKLLSSTLPKSIEVRQHITANPDEITGDPTQIHQVIMNLCTNAYHAMRERGGLLTIALENTRIDSPREFMSLSVPPGNYVRLSVSDTGHGIAPEILGKIFEPYFTTKNKSEGTGLGLSVTMGIVKGLNGFIEVESQLGEGTRFDLYFPATSASVMEMSAPAGPLPTGKQEKVLVVDDEAFFLDVLKENLLMLGYQVTANRSSVKSLEIFRQNPKDFDLVITDQSMPDMTGVQLVAEIRKCSRDVPIILCTGYSDIVSEQSATYYGITKFLMKPITYSDLAWAVHRALVGEEAGTQRTGNHV